MKRGLIVVKIYNPQRDALRFFPKSLESAYKILKQTEFNIDKQFKVGSHEFITFIDTKDFITILTKL